MTPNTTSFYRIQLTTVLGRKKTRADGTTESSTAEARVGRLVLWKQAPSVSSEALRSARAVMDRPIQGVSVPHD